MSSSILTVARELVVDAGVMMPDAEKSWPIVGVPESTGVDVLQVVLACATGTTARRVSASTASRMTFGCLLMRFPPWYVDREIRMDRVRASI